MFNKLKKRGAIFYIFADEYDDNKNIYRRSIRKKSRAI